MLSKKAKYALNALVYLAREHKKGNTNPVQTATIAEQERIPSKFLEAILLELKKAGILSSKKGKGGGYYLLKSPDSVNLAEIMRLMDGPIALLPCVSEMRYERCEECKNEEVCGIRDVFQQVRSQTFSILQQSTLASIMDRGAFLESSLLNK